MGLPFLVVVCWVFVAGDNSGFNLEQHMNERDKTAQMMQDSAGNSWGTEAHFQAFADLICADERERIKAANAPEIERINTYLKKLEDCIRARGNT